MRQTTTTIPRNFKLLAICCKTQLSKEEVQFLQPAFKEIGEETSNDENKWQDFLDLAAVHGVLPLVYESVERYARELISGENYSQLKMSHMGIVGRNMLMSAELSRVLSILKENDIETLPFKGPILAQLAYSDIALRQYSDLDFLINKDQLYKAIEVLEEREYKPVFQMTPAQYRSYTSISHDYSLTSPKSNILIELHWRLQSNEFMVDIDEIDYFDNPTEVAFQGKAISTFELEPLLLYLAVHGAKHQWERLGWLLDIERLIENQPIDWAYLLELSRKTDSLQILLTTMLLCKILFGVKLPPDLNLLLEDKSIQRKAKNINSQFIANFEESKNNKVRTKTVSLTQLQQLSGIKNKFLFITSIFKPTPLDFESMKLPDKLAFLYYFSRPVNVIRRWKDKYF